LLCRRHVCLFACLHRSQCNFHDFFADRAE
jgi:hypothetical protein